MYTIELIYCAAWNYTERAIRAMAVILSEPELERAVKTFTLIPSDGGRFEFSVDGKLLYSKLQTGRHAEEKELNKILQTHLGG